MGVPRVLRRLVVVVQGVPVDLPAVLTVVPLHPPAVEDAEVEPAVGRRFHPARPARLERRPREVDPHVAAAHDRRRHGEVVVLEEGDARGDSHGLREAEDVDEHLLRVVVERVGLAGHDHLQRRAVGEHPPHPLGVVREEEQALVRRDPPREAQGQGVLGERLGDRHHVLRVLAAEEAILDGLDLHVVDEQPPRLVAGRPQLLVRDSVDRRPGLRGGGALEPAVAEVAVEKRAHRRREEGGEVDAVRDVRDRDVVRGRVAEERPPHLAGDLAVAQADGVRPPRQAQGERRHPGPLVAPGMRAAEVEEALRVHPEPSRKVAERLDERRRLVGLVPGGDGGVRREHASRARGGERVVERDARPRPARPPARAPPARDAPR